MTWKPMSRARELTSHAKSSTPVALSGMAGRRSKTCLVIRPTLLTKAAWIAPGARVDALDGDGEHAGMVRLQVAPDGAFFLAKAGGKRNTATLMMYMPWLEGVAPVKQAPTAVDFDYGDGWLELTLPDWARPPKSAKAKEPPEKPVEAQAPPPAAPVAPSPAPVPPAPAVPPMERPAGRPMGGMAGAAAAAAGARARAGYSGITARVPDPAAADRAATRRAGGL